MNITVLRPGLLTSIQDRGRRGFQKYGVIVSGVMDDYAHRLANIIVGNEPGEGVLEMSLFGPSLRLEQDSLLAITGGDMEPSINGIPVPMWRPVFVRRGSVLDFKSCRRGCYSYLAVAGGYAIAPVMGSKSTYLRAGIGGFQGRALQEGDILPISTSLPEQACRLMKQLADRLLERPFIAADWFVPSAHIPEPSQPISVRVTRGGQYDLFTPESQAQFFNSLFQVSPQSDRMGCRLAGPGLILCEALEMVSEPVVLGTVQVPPDGNPIVLMADRQTAGGYPCIAQAAAVDAALIAQAGPGDLICFQEISIKEAETLYLERESYLLQIQEAVALRVG